MIEQLINYEGIGSMSNADAHRDVTEFSTGSIQKLIEGGITVTSHGSADYTEPTNELHREIGPVQAREYSGGFGY